MLRAAGTVAAGKGTRRVRVTIGTKVKVTVAVKSGKWSVKAKLPKALRRSKRLKVVIAYLADSGFKSQTVRRTAVRS